MELGYIEREIFVDAPPEVVYDVVSIPDHVRQWWPDDAHYDPTPGASGQLVFGTDANATIETFTVVEAHPPHRFSFRWKHPATEPAGEGNSMLVVFELAPSRGGTLLTMTETGFREMGWEAAVLAERYRGHVTGWNFYLPRLERYLDAVAHG